MKILRTIVTPARLIVLGILLTGLVKAGPFVITKRTFEIPESGEVTNTVVRTLAHDFTFHPPPEWKTTIDDKARVLVWTSPDYGTVLKLRIEEIADQPGRFQPEEVERSILNEMPGAKVVEQFPCFTSGGRGIAFDLEREDRPSTTSIRLAFIPFSQGLVQVSLTSPLRSFSEQQVVFTRFLNSLRIEAVSPK